MQDKPKVVKASPKERKSERSENGNRREEEMEKKTRRERVNGVRMGKEEMEKTRTGHMEGGASIMGRGKRIRNTIQYIQMIIREIILNG